MCVILVDLLSVRHYIGLSCGLTLPSGSHAAERRVLYIYWLLQGAF